MSHTGFNSSAEHAFWLLEFSKKAEKAHLIKELPAGFLPPWITDKSYVPPDATNTYYIVGGISLILAFLMVLSRLYTRAILMKNFGLDDWLMIAAMLSSGLYFACYFCHISYAGAARHIWDLAPETIYLNFKLIYFHIASYILAIFLIKMSILFLYRRIIPEKSNLHRILDIFFLFHIAYFVVAELVFCLQCDPPRAALDLVLRINSNPRCLDMEKLFYSFGILHVVLDIALLGLPLKVVWHLNVPTKKKATVVVMFVVGGIACFCPIMRMVSLHRLLSGHDFTWDIAEPGMWGILEVAIGIICASIPPAKILFSQLYRKFWFGALKRPISLYENRNTPAIGVEKKIRYGLKFDPSEERSGATDLESGSELDTIRTPKIAYRPQGKKNQVRSLQQLAVGAPAAKTERTFLKSMSDISSERSISCSAEPPMSPDVMYMDSSQRVSTIDIGIYLDEKPPMPPPKDDRLDDVRSEVTGQSGGTFLNISPAPSIPPKSP